MRPMRIYVTETDVDESTIAVRRQQAIEAYSNIVEQSIKAQTGLFNKSLYSLVPAQGGAAQKLFDMIEGSGKGKISFFETVQQDGTGYMVKAKVYFPINPALFQGAFANSIDPGKRGYVEVDFYFGIFRNLRNLANKNLRIECSLKQFTPDEMFDARVVLPVVLSGEKLELLTVIADSNSEFGKKQWFKADDGSIYGVEIVSYAGESPPGPSKKAGVSLAKKS